MSNEVVKIATLRVIDLDNKLSKFNVSEIESLKNDYNETNHIYVTFANDSYSLTGNEDHFYASKLLKKSFINVVLDENDYTKIRHRLSKRVANENLNPMLSAYLYQELCEICKMKQFEISKLVNKKQGAISNKMRLLKLPLVVQAAMLSSKIKERHGREILQLSYRGDFATISEKITGQIIINNLNVQETVDLIYKIEGRPITKLENLRMKDISENLKKRELKMVINEINREMIALNEKVKKHFPDLKFEISEGISGEDYVFLLKMRGVNDNE